MNRRGLLKLKATLAPLSAPAQRVRTGTSPLKITNVEAFVIRTPKDGTPPETTVAWLRKWLRKCTSYRSFGPPAPSSAWS